MGQSRNLSQLQADFRDHVLNSVAPEFLNFTLPRPRMTHGSRAQQEAPMESCLTQVYPQINWPHPVSVSFSPFLTPTHPVPPKCNSNKNDLRNRDGESVYSFILCSIHSTSLQGSAGMFADPERVCQAISKHAFPAQT